MNHSERNCGPAERFRSVCRREFVRVMTGPRPVNLPIRRSMLGTLSQQWRAAPQIVSLSACCSSYWRL